MSQPFTPEQHLQEVLAAYGNAGEPRHVELAQGVIRHLLAFVEEVDLTREEWFAAMQFLNAVGQKSDDVRDEFILLSDTLGVSMLVEMLNHRAAPGTTEPTVFGPFHVDGAPTRNTGDSIGEQDLGGDELVFTGTVKSIDGTPLAGATLDVWEAAPSGLYDIQDPDMADMNCRGIFETDADGNYRFSAPRPPAYQIPDDGPVGKMLETMARHPWRPGHTHFVIDADGHKSVITHLFDSASDYLDSDAVFGTRESLIVDMSGPEVTFDFVLQPME